LQSELLVCKPAGATWSLCKLASQPRWLAKPAEPSSQQHCTGLQHARALL
jgi:hypothetical protein